MGIPTGPPELVSKYTESLLQQLKNLRPGLIIANKGMLPRENLIVQWMVENYVTVSPTPEQVERFIFLVPNDEKLGPVNFPVMKY